MNAFVKNDSAEILILNICLYVSQKFRVPYEE